MISLALRRVARLRWCRPDASRSRSHHGANCCQNVSTEQYKSSSPHAQRLQHGIDGSLVNRIISLSKAFCLSKIHVLLGALTAAFRVMSAPMSAHLQTSVEPRVAEHRARATTFRCSVRRRGVRSRTRVFDHTIYQGSQRKKLL